MKEIKSRFLKFVRSKKINVFTLFVLLSFSILILNKLSRTFTNTIPFSVKVINLPETYVLLNDSSLKLNVTMKTFGFKFLNYYISNPNVVLDYKDKIQLNDSTFAWINKKSFSKISSQFHKDVEVLGVYPDTLKFFYDVNATKDVPVVLQKKITFSPGFDVNGTYKLSPDTIHIIGPGKLVNSIKRIKTEPLELSDIHYNINQTLNIELPKNSTGLQFSHKSVKLSAEVEKFTEGTFNIPVTIKNVPKGLVLKYYPKSVSVSYYTNLSVFNTVKDIDFKVECDYNNHVENQSFLVPELVAIPKSVKSAKINQQKVEFIISE